MPVRVITRDPNGEVATMTLENKLSPYFSPNTRDHNSKEFEFESTYEAFEALCRWVTNMGIGAESSEHDTLVVMLRHARIVEVRS